MTFLKGLFGKRNKQEDDGPILNLPWIEASENLWNRRLLDLRPISETMLSSSKDQQMAKNALSYNSEDGRIFWGQVPYNENEIRSEITLPIDRKLEPGVLFVPDVMEHKWAIYFDGEQLIFIHSWLREVIVTARTSQKENQLIIESIRGKFTADDETEQFTNAILNFLLISHVIGDIIPAPLPKEFVSDTKSAALWAFSNYGNMAKIGVFDEEFRPSTLSKLRSHSLLHIAVAQSNLEEIEMQIKNGIDANSLANDGLGPLHWSITAENTEAMEKLIEMGASIDTRSTEGATPLMQSVQDNKIAHAKMLIDDGAFVNAIDNRGFTALHRAAEMGLKEMVKMLLFHDADRDIQAEGYTAMSLAEMREQLEIVELLKNNK